MARKRNEVSDSLLIQLKRDVELRSGFTINGNKDCKRLSELIFESTRHNISSNTLRRIWGFEDCGFSVSSSTIEILQLYVGHTVVPDAVLNFEAEFVLDFYRPLHFESIDFNDKSFQASCRKIAKLMKSNSALFHRVMEALAKSKMGQKFYFDLFPDYDILHLFQYKGYLIYWENAQEANDQLFVSSILARAFYFRGDQESAKRWADKAHEIFQMKKQPFHSFTLGRFFFAMLVTTEDEGYQYWLAKAKEQEKNISRHVEGDFNEFPGFHYLICDAFYLKKDYASLLFFAEKGLADFQEFPEFAWKGYYDQLRIFRAFAISQLDRDPDAMRSIAKIDSSGFYFISRNYFHSILNRLI